MNKIRLIDLIDNENFNPNLFDGFILHDINFVKYFYFLENSINEIYTQINEFLTINGYNPLDFKNKWGIDGIDNELMCAYINPYYNENENANIILVIYRNINI